VAKIRISVVQYLNSVPLAWGILEGPHRDTFEAAYSTPAECAQELSAGNVDIGLIPSIEYQRIAGCTIVPGPAIASRHRAASVLLLSKVPLARVRTVACDRGSRSSVALARAILNGYYRNKPEFREADPNPEAMLRASDAALLIGDIALRFKADNKFSTSFKVNNYGQEGPQPIQVFDLVERWNTLTGLPFVFAFWAARKDFADRSVVEALVESRAFGLANLDKITERYAETLGLDRDFLMQYLGKNMDYNMDRYGVEALLEFYAMAARAGAINSVRSLEFL
jgi:chorismate dehydratase